MADDTTNALRAQFERWADTNGYGPKFRESMFAAYEAGAALATAQSEAKPEGVHTCQREHFWKGRDYCEACEPSNTTRQAQGGGEDCPACGCEVALGACVKCATRPPEDTER